MWDWSKDRVLLTWSSSSRESRWLCVVTWMEAVNIMLATLNSAMSSHCWHTKSTSKSQSHVQLPPSSPPPPIRMCNPPSSPNPPAWGGSLPGCHSSGNGGPESPRGSCDAVVGSRALVALLSGQQVVIVPVEQEHQERPSGGANTGSVLEPACVCEIDKVHMSLLCGLCTDYSMSFIVNRNIWNSHWLTKVIKFSAWKQAHVGIWNPQKPTKQYNTFTPSLHFVPFHQLVAQFH